jgi:hypothetical protein
MPWLPLYATAVDMKWLLEQLSGEAELAFLVSAGSRKWIAQKKLEFSEDRRFCLWHIPSGPLPLLGDQGNADGVISDPWTGWIEERTGVDSANPYFGSGHVGIFWLNAHTRSKSPNQGIGLSSFEWIGNRYSLIGRSAPEATDKFWQRLGRKIKKRAVRIPREGLIDAPNPEIWALADALAQIRLGCSRDPNP